MSAASGDVQRDREDVRVVGALRFAGLNINSIYDLVNMSTPYPEAIPILLQLLPGVSHHIIKEGIVRALTVK